MNMPHRSTNYSIHSSEVIEKLEREAREYKSRTIQERFFLGLILVIGAIGFMYVMSNPSSQNQESNAIQKEEFTKAGFFAGK